MTMTSILPGLKDTPLNSSKEVHQQEAENTVINDLQSTQNDIVDMSRMGKSQELRRTFRYYSTLAFVTVLTATWEFLLIANTNGLVDGGRPGLFWSLIWSIVGMGLIIASLAEMSSMAPTSGGQYHWVSEFAPQEWQKFLSYTSGTWYSSL
jgi:choline transport protein